MSQDRTFGDRNPDRNQMSHAEKTNARVLAMDLAIKAKQPLDTTEQLVIAAATIYAFLVGESTTPAPIIPLTPPKDAA